jgi:glycosyltransferase involved in cell wall biosynthesis
VEILVRASDRIDATVYIVGGYQDDVERIREVADGMDNVVITGFVEPTAVPTYQIAADILVAPYTSQARDSLSPLKLFEYMAAGRPIVASDLDVLREVLTDGDNSLLMPPENPTALAARVEEIFKNNELYNSLATRTKECGLQYTWERRAEEILSFVDGL